MTRPVPDVAKKPLAFSFPKPAPAPGQYQSGTAQFRYWTAAEALRRGADYWATRASITQWQMGPTLKVILDDGEDLNAFYDRKALWPKESLERRALFPRYERHHKDRP